MYYASCRIYRKFRERIQSGAKFWTRSGTTERYIIDRKRIGNFCTMGSKSIRVKEREMRVSREIRDSSRLKYLLYLPDQQLLHIEPTFPPIFLAITRCAAMRRLLLPAVSLDSVMDVPLRVMSTTAATDEIFCPLHARESPLFRRRVSPSTNIREQKATASLSCQ